MTRIEKLQATGIRRLAVPFAAIAIAALVGIVRRDALSSTPGEVVDASSRSVERTTASHALVQPAPVGTGRPSGPSDLRASSVRKSA